MFEWDDAKSRRNFDKHGVEFEIARHIFDGPVLSFLDGRNDYGEARRVSIGRVGDAVLVVVHTERGEATRLISARRANRKERRLYEQAVQ
jgi:uncharacterized DUF497 family protein